MTTRERALLALAVASAITLAACAGGGDDGGSAATTAAPSGALVTTVPGGGAGDTAPAGTAAAGGTDSGLPDLDPCGLLTDDDVNAGFALSDLRSPITKVERTRNDAPGSASCTYAWTAQNDSSSSFAVYVYGPDVYQGLQSSGTAETVPELPGAYKTFDGLFLGTPKATVSITGVASDAAAASLLSRAAENAS